MRILVTGAAGFVGSHLIERLEQESGEPPAEVVAWFRPGTEPLVRGSRVRWQGVELHDRAAVVAAVAEARPTLIYHLAGAAHVGDSWSHSHETFAGNVLGTHHLFTGLRQASLRPRVLITSTAMVYAPAGHAITEHDIVRPNNPYGTSKVAQEMLGLRAWQDDGIPVLIARAFNHIGPRQSPSFVASSIAKQIAEIESGSKPPVLAMGNLDPLRDIMDVRDTVRAYRAMMEAAEPGRAYNVCSGHPTAIKTLVELMQSHAKVPVRIEQDPARFRRNDHPLLLGDHSRLTADTGWMPQLTLEQTVDDLLNYWRSVIVS